MQRIIITLIILSSIPLWAKNEPCSGKKGGVVGCTADGKYQCKDGSVSQSKKKCVK